MGTELERGRLAFALLREMREALRSICKRYDRMLNHEVRLCPNELHYPLRNPFCDRCQVAARIEESVDALARADELLGKEKG